MLEQLLELEGVPEQVLVVGLNGNFVAPVVEQEAVDLGEELKALLLPEVEDDQRLDEVGIECLRQMAELLDDSLELVVPLESFELGGQQKVLGMAERMAVG